MTPVSNHKKDLHFPFFLFLDQQFYGSLENNLQRAAAREKNEHSISQVAFISFFFIYNLI